MKRGIPKFPVPHFELPVFASTDPRVKVVPDPQDKAPRKHPGARAHAPVRARTHSAEAERYALAELRWRHSPARAALLRRQASPGRADLDLARAKAVRAKLGPSPFTSQSTATPTRMCPMCNGSGRLYDLQAVLGLPCPNCNGTGRVSAKGDSGGKVTPKRRDPAVPVRARAAVARSVSVPTDLDLRGGLLPFAAAGGAH